jgi:nicotinamide-nucleotide amidase
MKAEIISIGTELLLGEITDTNASYLAAQLPLLGIDLLWVTQVGDNFQRLKECLDRAWERSDIILATGGLGPTEDDLTREAIAATLGESMTIDRDLERRLVDFFKSRGIPMPQSNLKQAMLIPSAKAIPNPRGSAPGWWVEVRETPCPVADENPAGGLRKRGAGEKSPARGTGGVPQIINKSPKTGGLRGLKSEARTLPHIIIAMPGPPAEMQHMWANEVSRRLREMLGDEIILSRTIKTLGLTEAGVDEKVSHLLSSTNPSLGIYAKPDGIHLRITAKAASVGEAGKMIARREAELRPILGDIIWGYDDETLEGIVGALLTERGLTLVTMESCTGGLLANTITDVPGSSKYFRGGLVAYTNEAKIDYGVSAALIDRHGAVSAEVALDMARAARERLSANVGVGITGVAGPDELEGKPAGTVHIAIDDGRNQRHTLGRYPPLRHQVKRRATYAALFELRRVLTAFK